jgi:hypothetical protein
MHRLAFAIASLHCEASSSRWTSSHPGVLIFPLFVLYLVVMAVTEVNRNTGVEVVARGWPPLHQEEAFQF